MLNLFIIMLAVAMPAEDSKTYSNDELGIVFSLPGEDWALNDQSKGTAKILIFSPEQDLSLRCCVLYLPRSAVLKGLLTREEQIKGKLPEHYERVAYTKDELDGKKCDLLEYAMLGTTTREYGIPHKAFFMILQLSARDNQWADSATRKKLEQVKTSFRFKSEPKVVVPTKDLSSPTEIRAKRWTLRPDQSPDFEITRHEVFVEVNPPGHTLEMRDKIRIKALKRGLRSIKLYYSVIDIESVEPSTDVSYRTLGPTKLNGPWTLLIDFKRSMIDDEEKVINVTGSCDDYIQIVNQSLVEEVAVMGQVREKSSYSSHILYYPIDERNNAAVDLQISVPSGFTAVTGGRLKNNFTDGGRAVFHYSTKIRKPRALPFGFAVAKYITAEAQSKGGLPLTVYGYPGEERLIRQRADVAKEAANLFEKMMGPLPFEAVRFAHVSPERKEMGVSLPGLILISDGYFDDIERVDLSDGNLERRDVLSLLILADELAHQWNFYSVPLPNELAEGVSTFTNALFVEHRHGKEAYRKVIQRCADAYLKSTRLGKDVAIADPAIYETEAYRGIAFCKVPCVLDMLRTRLGDDAFFAAWRKAFQQFDEKQDGYRILEEAFQEAYQEERPAGNLTYFFDQWFYMAGYPKIMMSYTHDGRELTVNVDQIQKGRAFVIHPHLLIKGRSGKTLDRPFSITNEAMVFRVPCDLEVKDVVFDPEGLIPLKEIKE